MGECLYAQRLMRERYIFKVSALTAAASPVMFVNGATSCLKAGRVPDSLYRPSEEPEWKRRRGAAGVH